MQVKKQLRHLSSSLKLLRNASSLVQELIQKAKADPLAAELFWVKEALDPLHSAMSSVHEIYLRAFYDLRRILDDDPQGSLTEALEYLSKCHLETQTTRESLQGMRRSLRLLVGVPVEIGGYLLSCEAYFSNVTGQAVSTPLRSLLEGLSRIDKRLDQHDRFATDSRAEEARGAVYLVADHVEKAWPNVVTAYYASRLRLLYQTDREQRVLELVEKKYYLINCFKPARIHNNNKINDILKEIDLNLIL